MSDIDISFQKKMEQSMEEIHSESFDNWVQNFAMNLNDIWHEPSAMQLSQKIESNENHSAIVIGRGPSIKKHKHLELLANSDFDGSIVCTDGSLIDVLESGITPEKFPKFYVVTIDPYSLIKKFYDNKIVKKYGRKINGIFSTIVHPDVVNCAREAGVKIHWLHTLFDYNEGKKSFNHIAALIVRAKNHPIGLPAIQTGGNAGTSSWFVSWKILKNNTIGFIGINHGWEEGDDITKIIKSHQSQTIVDDVNIIDKNHPKYNIYFKKLFNPDFNCECIVDPLYQFYRMALIEFIERSPSWLTTINATEGGSIFGKRIKSMKFEDFLKIYKN